MEEVRNLIRESIKEVIQEEKSKRYVAKMELYVWAPDEQSAKEEAAMIAKEIDAKYDNHASIVELGEQSHGTMDYFPVDLDL